MAVTNHISKSAFLNILVVEGNIRCGAQQLMLN